MSPLQPTPAGTASTAAPTVAPTVAMERECDLFGPGARFHHVGLGVRSVRDALRGDEPIPPTPEPTQGVSLAFLNLHGVRVELLEPLDVDSPILASLEKGTKLLHLCFEVPRLEEALAHCRSAGFHRLGRPRAAAAMNGARIAWVFHKELGLFELLEQTGSITPAD